MRLVVCSFIIAAAEASYSNHAGLTRVSTPIPTVEIAPGVHMPLAGIGTWLYNSSMAEKAVLTATSLGCTHIDTALGYGNQDGVARAISKSGIAREKLFVVSKIPGGFNQTAAAAALDESLEQLFPGQEDAYVDLMLVHFPATWKGQGGKASRQAQWKAMEAFVHAGKAKAIGISHYCRRHLDDLLEMATIKPAVNQVRPDASGPWPCRHLPSSSNDQRSHRCATGPVPRRHGHGWPECHRRPRLHACQGRDLPVLLAAVRTVRRR
jgi:hypothetical protein